LGSKTKVGVTVHFSEIIEFEFRKKMPYIVLYFTAFLELSLLNYLGKMRGCPQFSFWIPVAFAGICVFPTVITSEKVPLPVLGTVLKFWPSEIHKVQMRFYLPFLLQPILRNTASNRTRKLANAFSCARRRFFEFLHRFLDFLVADTTWGNPNVSSPFSFKVYKRVQT